MNFLTNEPLCLGPSLPKKGIYGDANDFRECKFHVDQIRKKIKVSNPFY